MHEFENEVAYVGPHLSEGPLPTLFYFSLSAKDSLLLDPFNQPVVHLSHLPMRIFSVTLPGHENNLPPTEALNKWAEAFARGHNVIAEFVDHVARVVSKLKEQGAIVENKLGVAGLSRGAFLAAHAAAVIADFHYILGFAPLTKLIYARELQDLSELEIAQRPSLEHIAENLVGRPLRFYIGNLDTRVGTKNCFNFIEKLAEISLQKGIRSPEVELMITPSIGREGHGTSKAIFHSGAKWMAQKLGVWHV